jgi:hypothetical protein
MASRCWRYYAAGALDNGTGDDVVTDEEFAEDGGYLVEDGSRSFLPTDLGKAQAMELIKYDYK